MTNIDTDYLSTLVIRFKAFNKPTDAQQLIIALGDKLDRTDDDDKKLNVLLRAEKKADELAKARAGTRKLIDAEKAQARKLEVRKKIVWGAALKTAAQNEPQMASVMVWLFDSGYIAEKDKDAVMADYKAHATSNDG